MGDYAIQVMGIDTKEPKPTQPKINHYKYMKQNVKSNDAKQDNKYFSIFLAEWDENENMEENLMMPISVPSHCKR